MKIHKLRVAACCTLALLTFFSAPKPVWSHGYFTSCYSIPEMIAYVYSLFNRMGEWTVIESSPDRLVIARPYDKEKIRFSMPMKYRRRDGRSSHRYGAGAIRERRNRWDIDERDFRPVHRADEFVTFFGRRELDGRNGVIIRHDVYANYGMYGEEHVRKDDFEYFTLSKYCETFLDGGYGAGFSTVFTNANMYIADVFEGSEAQRAGIRPGDRIRLINKTVASTVDPEYFGKKYQWAELGKTFTLALERPSKERYTVQLRVDYIPAQTERLKKVFGRPDVPAGKSRDEVFANVR